MFQRAGTSSGGGGSIKSGTLDNITAGSTVTISTGLSVVNRFVIAMDWVRTGVSQPISVAVYDRATSDNTYDVATGVNANSGYGGQNRPLGTAISASMCFTINSVTGGDVSISIPSTYGYSSYCVWYAE